MGAPKRKSTANPRSARQRWPLERLLRGDSLVISVCILVGGTAVAQPLQTYPRGDAYGRLLEKQPIELRLAQLRLPSSLVPTPPPRCHASSSFSQEFKHRDVVETVSALAGTEAITLIRLTTGASRLGVRAAGIWATRTKVVVSVFAKQPNDHAFTAICKRVVVSSAIGKNIVELSPRHCKKGAFGG
jgi:hypothetical protein